MTEEQLYSMGIDEAGRGPVIGPMVYCCAFTLKRNVTDLKLKFKVDDSKALTAKERDSIFQNMSNQKNQIHHHCLVIGPHELSTKMLRKNKYNLNKISHDAAIELIKMGMETIQKFGNGAVLHDVYVDTVGDCKKYQKKT